jgi:hypothetical protein
MNPLKDLLTGGIGGIFSGAKDIINQFVANPEQKLEATQKMAELETGFREKQIEAERDFAAEQAKVVIAEAQSDSWLAKNWRPITMLTFVAIIVWNYIVVGTIGAFVPSIHVVEIPTDMWGLLKLGIGGYIGSRTLEKVADSIVPAIAAKKAQ